MDEPKETEKLIDDIFGDDDDDFDDVNNNSAGPASTRAAPGGVDNDDDIFGVSDSDDGAAVPVKRGRLSKKKSEQNDGFDIDSEDDDVADVGKQSSIRIRRRNKKVKSSDKKNRLKRRSSRGEDRLPKRQRNEENSGDEYNSEGEPEANEQDKAFIDDEEDYENAGVVAEYNKETQNFDDDQYYAGKKQKSTTRKSTGGSTVGTRDADPLSETLRTMKNPKAKGLTEQEKEVFVNKLQLKMAEAVIRDERDYQEGRPALHKIKLLDAVQQAVSMRPLHQTLLDKDILGSLRDWITPRGTSTTSSLPALSVRSTVYDLLLLLPCQPEHLKRGSRDGKVIGEVIVQLRKHKQETTENKKKLREIMDKWSRPIFSKNADVRMTASGSAVLHDDNAEIRQAVVQRYYKNAENSESHSSADIVTNSGINSTGDVRFDSIMTAATGSVNAGNTAPRSGLNTATANDLVSKSKKDAAMDPHGRVRTPYNQGFLFTVRPELKQLDKRDQMEKTLGEGRMKIYKKTIAGGKAKALLGRKTNPRAIDLSVSGGGIKS